MKMKVFELNIKIDPIHAEAGEWIHSNMNESILTVKCFSSFKK